MNHKILAAIAVVSFALAGCSKPDAGANAQNTNAANPSNANKSSNATAGQPSNTATPVNANANSNVNKPVDNTPKRIVFSKGANWGTANVTLAPGAGAKFVVGAKSGQMMDVEASSKEVSINLIKGKAQTTEDFGYLNAELKANGDYIFEVRNSTKKEVKTSVKVTIESPTEEGDGAEDNQDVEN